MAYFKISYSPMECFNPQCRSKKVSFKYAKDVERGEVIYGLVCTNCGCHAPFTIHKIEGDNFELTHEDHKRFFFPSLKKWNQIPRHYTERIC